MATEAERLLPTARQAGSTYRIAVVCLGNICRSPIAEVVLTRKIAQAGLAGEVSVVSAGTGDWHVGQPMDRRAAVVLTARGYDPSLHRAAQFGPDRVADCDLVLAMDQQNLSDITDLSHGVDEQRARVRLFRDFDPLADDTDRDVPDPYYGADDGFDSVVAMVERTADALVRALGSMTTATGEART